MVDFIKYAAFLSRLGIFAWPANPVYEMLFGIARNTPAKCCLNKQQLQSATERATKIGTLNSILWW